MLNKLSKELNTSLQIVCAAQSLLGDNENEIKKVLLYPDSSDLFVDIIQQAFDLTSSNVQTLLLCGVVYERSIYARKFRSCEL